jgi:hypothetical protein
VDSDSLKIASDKNGKHVVLAWTSGDKVLLRFLREDGTIKRFLRADGPTLGKPSEPALAFDSTSKTLLVVWTQEQDDRGSDILGRFFSASGISIGPEFRVHSDPTGQQTQPKVVATTGGFIVVWRSTPVNSTPDPLATEVRAARLTDLHGQSVISFRVNQLLVGTQDKLTLATDELGDCILAWVRDGSESNGLFAKKLAQCRRTAGQEQHVSISEDRSVLTPSLLTTGGDSVGVVVGINDTLSGDGGVTFEPLPRQE